MTDVIEWSGLPASVFISHAYLDVAAKERLLGLIPEHVRSVVWPPRERDPREAVSDGIVEQIRQCEGLIYIDGAYSEDSIWVNFEKDYARRSGRRVFAFDPEEELVREDRASPIPLNARLLISHGQEGRAEQLLQWMKDERSFHLSGGATRVRMKEIGMLVAELLADSTVALWLLDGRLSGVAQQVYEVPVDMVLDHFAFMRGNGNAYYSEGDLDGYQRWLAMNSMYVRLTPDWEPTHSEDPDEQAFILSEYPIARSFHAGWAVDIGSSDGDGTIDWSRADDLIVRLTLMLQQVQPFLPDED